MCEPIKKRKKICPQCRRKLWLREFSLLKNGHRHSWCHECVVSYKREQYKKHRKVPDGIFMQKKTNRIVEHKGYSTRVFWSENMLSTLKRHYHNTINRELAEILGISQRCVGRKAKELDLKKDKEFIAFINKQNLLLANIRGKELGHPCGFRNGIEFKGNQYTGKIRIK